MVGQPYRRFLPASANVVSGTIPSISPLLGRRGVNKVIEFGYMVCPVTLAVINTASISTVGVGRPVGNPTVPV